LLLSAELVIADLSGHNPNVYYEVAMRHCVCKPCVLLVEGSDVPPFDTRGLRMIQLDMTKDGKPARDAIRQAIRHFRDGHHTGEDSPVWQSMVQERMRELDGPDVAKALGEIANVGSFVAKLVATVDTLGHEVQRMRQLIDGSKDFSALRNNIQRAETAVRRADSFLAEGGEDSAEMALGFYDEALGVQPDHQGALIGKAKALVRRTPPDYPEAIGILSRVIDGDPSSARAYYNRACYRSLSGADAVTAISDLTEAVRLAPHYRKHARMDKDFSRLRDMAEFRALISDSAGETGRGGL
jgi:tetratricopeptide (TPR) repeat protein